ncbi:MAG: glycosyltransferase family 2 protein [Anaerolineaceae bacterium]|nr:glycosyltransferase family 2 protein [Anaerolineaceae bacterium]MDD4578425.1 glycosyltransferase family 2 protein [Anaerolineaceae bacterium]
MEVHSLNGCTILRLSKINVSVVIPVYNAAVYVSQAVESALAQPETAEVLLVEDGSPDNALEVCEDLANKHDKVKLLRHPNGENRGAGASRNLGMRAAKKEYIAFLDADDYFLPGRFRQALELFNANPDCEGVYEAVGMLVDGSESLERWQLAGRRVKDLQTMSDSISPKDLAEVLIKGSDGYFHLDGLIIKKGVLQRSGLMNENLHLHQDTEFIMRLAMTARLLPGKLDEPVAMWRVHQENRISAPRSLTMQYRDRMRYWRSLYQWVRQNGSPKQQQRVRAGIFSYNRATKFQTFSKRILPIRVIIFGRQLRLLAWPQLIFDHLASKNNNEEGCL